MEFLMLIYALWKQNACWEYPEFFKTVQKAVSRIMLSIDNATDNIAFGFEFNFEPKGLKSLISDFFNYFVL